MFIVEHYSTAVIFCIVTMLCWGSWANAQKAVGKRWRFELFYWDYVIGLLVMSLLFAYTLGNNGENGRTFTYDVKVAVPAALGWAFLGGVIFNAANILLVAAIALSGMAVAFPVGIGLALIVGVAVSYWQKPQGNLTILFAGVACIVAAIVLDALAYGRLPREKNDGRFKGVVLALLCGALMGCFYPLVAASLPEKFVTIPFGKISPYTAMVCFAAGVLLSNFLFNTILMKRPISGSPVRMSEYFKGTRTDHLWGIIGGAIWAVGMMLNLLASGEAGPAISYGLGQGATMVAALWGVFVWREFRTAPRGTGILLGLMFIGYLAGLTLVIASGAT